MKKKLFRSFIVSLFVFTLFISGSNAETIAPEIYYAPSGLDLNANINVNMNSTGLCGYTNNTIYNIVNSYIRNSDDDAKKTSFLELFEKVKQDYIYVDSYVAFRDTSSNSSVVELLFYSTETIEVGSQLRRLFYNLEGPGKFIRVYLTNSKAYISEINIPSSILGWYSLSSGFDDGVDTLLFPETLSIKSLAMYDNQQLMWDGESYYYQASSEPEVPAGPEFITELTDDEIASVVQNFSNSTYWKNRNSNYTGFFIQRNELNGHYAVMVVPSHLVNYKSVEGIYIPANVTTSNYPAMDHDTYSVGYIKTGIPQLPWNQWLESFKIYDSSDSVNFNYVGEMHASEYMEYRIPMTTPIIFSNFTIPFKTLMGETIDEDGEITDSFTEESDFDFSNLINSETGESYEFEDVPVEDNPIIRALGEFFKDLTGYLSSAFEFVLNKIFNFSEYLISEFGENVFTLLFAIIIEAFSALVAGISLLVRFAGFILTLVAIPADSSLFNVLVDGSVWGIHFIEGLNFLKGLSWNNLNLWTLFECFVATIEVIWTVKIVRRHYSQVV